jgi:heat shock protein HslJ
MRRFPRCTAAGRLLGVVMFTVGVAACGSGRAVESKALVPRSPGDLDGTHWILVATHDSDPVSASTPFTLDIEKSAASGTGPCNRFHLSFTHDGNDVTTGPVVSTQMACPPAQAAAEHSFFMSLERVDTAEKEDTQDQLVLSGPHDTRLVFDPADRSADHIIGTWDIVNYATTNALTTPIMGTKPTLDFAADHSLTIETGCNVGTSTWKADGRSLTIEPPRSTLKACPTPGVGEQESSIFAALPRIASVDLARVNAVLLAADGSALFVLEPHV